MDGLKKILSIMLAAGYIVSAILIGVTISGKWLQPLIGQKAGTVSVDETKDVSAQATPDQTPALLTALAQEDAETEVALELPQIPAYAVAAGSFATLEEANQSALSLMQRGGAGYVIEWEGAYLVLLSAYGTEESAKKIAERLNGDGGLAMQAVDLSSGSVRLNLTTGQERANNIQQSYEAFASALQEIDAVWRALDKGESQTVEAVAGMGMIAAHLDQVRIAAFDGTLIEGDAQALSDWDKCMSSCIAYIQTISDSSQSAMAISAKIKYTYLACIAQYREYIQGMLA